MRNVSSFVLMISIGAVLAVAGATGAGAESLRIAMVLWRGETPAEKGFKDGVAKLGYMAGYVMVNAEQDRTKLRSRLEKTILPQLESFDYVYSFGTTASKMTKTLIKEKVPQLFNIVTDPVKAGIVSTMDEPGGNVSGVSQVVPLQAQIQSALKLFGVKKLGLLFNPREKNAMIQRDQIKRMADQHRFDLVDLRSPPALDRLEKNLEKLADKAVAVDAVYLPFDSFLISNAKLIGAKLRALKIKSIGATKAYVAGGALMGFVPDYYKLGETAASLLDRHRKGEDLGRIPVQQIYSTEPATLVVNETTQSALGLQFSEDILSKAVILK